jgi:hypothetical protein
MGYTNHASHCRREGRSAEYGEIKDIPSKPLHQAGHLTNDFPRFSAVLA